MAIRTTKDTAQRRKDQTRRFQIRKLIGIVMILAAVVLVILAVILFRSDESGGESEVDQSDYQAVLSDYYSALLEQNGETMMLIMAPPEYWDYYVETYEKTEDDIVSWFEEGCAETIADWEESYGGSISLSFQINGMSQQEQEGLEEWNSNMEAMLGSTGADISEAVTLEVQLTISGENGSGTEQYYPTLGKIDGNWYIIEEDNEELHSK